ncbi:MAG: hypothetical protein ACR2HJ_12220 [Fimbriimonadales bacterium]
MKSALMLIAVTLAVLFAGCSSDQKADTPESTDPASTDNSTTATPVVFKNDAGQIVCPVMGSTTDEKSAVGHQDHNGKRYYFCCGDCPEQFKADPAKFEEGKNLAAKDDGHNH